MTTDPLERPVALLYLHGIGDDGTKLEWLDDLHLTLGRQGSPSIDELGVPLIAPDYSDVLTADQASAPPPPRTETAPSTVVADARARFRLHQAHYAATLQQHGNQPFSHDRHIGFGRIPDPLDAIGERIVMGTVYDSVGRFVAQPARRSAALHRVLRAIPPDHDLVIVAHSLGALVAMDLLRHLPPRVDVRLLVTAATALGRRTLHPEILQHRHNLPYERLGGWLNVYNPRDAVTRGRGISHRFPAAVDVPVPAGLGNHHLGHLISEPGVAAVLGQALRQHHPLVPADSPFLDRRAIGQFVPLQFSFRLAEQMAGDPAMTARALADYDLARQLQREALPGALAEQLSYDDDLTDLLLGRIDEIDLPAALLTLVAADPVGPARIELRDQHVRQARQRVALDLGCNPSWTDQARESLARARRLVPERDSRWSRVPSRRADTDGLLDSPAGMLAEALTAQRLGMRGAWEQARRRAADWVSDQRPAKGMAELRSRVQRALQEIDWPQPALA